MRRRRSNGRTIAAVAALVMVVGAACNPTSTNQANSVDRAAVAKEATRQLEQAERQDLGCDNVVMSEERRVTTPPEHLVVLTDAYAVAEPCWDKLVFTFEPTGADMPPGYEIEYQKGPFTEGETNSPVETLGDAFLFLKFTPASEDDVDGKQAYKGNLRLTLKDMHHTEIVRKLIDGDGTVMWVIGLDAKRPFTVDAANKPPRVTVYVAR